MIRRLRLPRIFGRLQVRLLLLVLIALAAVMGVDAVTLWDARLQAVQAARTETTRLARSLADQSYGVFEMLDTVLVGLQERVEADGLEAAARRRLGRLLDVRVAGLGMLHRLMVVDAAGRMVIASGGRAPARNMADEPMFRQHQAAPGRGMFLGWPVRDPVDGTWVVTVSRRTDAADGGFAGVVVASVSIAMLEAGFGSLDAERQSVVLLARADGRAMARWPTDPRGPARNLLGGDLFRKIAASWPNDHASFAYTSMVDGLARFASFRQVSDLPAFVVIARSKDEVLGFWPRLVLFHAVGLAVVLVLTGGLGRRLAGKITEDQRAQTALQETHSRLALSEAGTARANRWLEMAEQMAQVGHWRFEVLPAPTVVWSDEVYRIHGLRRQSFDLTVDSAIGAYHPDDRTGVYRAYTAAVRSGTPFELTARIVRPGGVVRHILSRGLPQIDARGQTTGIFAVCIDITQQKQDEAALQDARARAEAANQALEVANRALEDMAMRDALTGLANRRHFDRALDMEFRRAMRAGSALALILIDVDHFKQFNDIYGHQAGDACLRAIAQAIPPLLNRPGDTANRYGGEEMVVLLPGNTRDGALEMALRIADAIRLLAIVHAGSPHGVVTISAGVEAFVPVHERDTVEALIEHADLALYAAKRAGRDQVLAYQAAGDATNTALLYQTP